MTAVVKVGSSSLTLPDGGVDAQAIGQICSQVADMVMAGNVVVVVTSGAIAAGWAALGGGTRPADLATLQAVSAIGQHRLMRVYDDSLARAGLHVGQVLLASIDFADRRQYLQARQTLGRLLELGVVPVVNENDATSDDEIRFGDNDRLAALVAQMVAADVLVLLTDAPGLLSVDPKLSSTGTLIEEVVEIDHRIEAVAGGAGSEAGSGGMASKLAAAKIASWSGIRTVIADAARPGVISAALSGEAGVGTVVRPRGSRLPQRKLWIAFAIGAAGTVVVDEGARSALVGADASLLPAGVLEVHGDFDAGEAVEIAGPDGIVFAKGLARSSSERVAAWAGQRTDAIPAGSPVEVVHRDDLVVLV